jgi:branched-chain amino acid transport system permease protein
VTVAIARLTGITRRYSTEDLLTVRLPLAILLIIPIFAPQFFADDIGLLSLAVTCAIYVIVACGLHIVFSHCGQLSLAHTTLWGVGAYAAALLLIHYSMPTVLLIPLAGLFGAAGAVVIGIPAFRAAGFSFAIITFAFAEIMRLIANNWSDLTRGNIGLTVLDAPDALGPIKFDTFNHLDNFYYLVLGFAYLSILGVVLIRSSRLGGRFIAIRENETLARSLGINVYLHKLIAFAISGFFAGVAGVFFVYHQKHIGPGPLSPFSAFFTIQFLLMILIGGRFTTLGPVIGAVITVFAPRAIDAVFGDALNYNRIQMIFGVTLMLSVLTAPNGIAGQAAMGHRTFFAVLHRSRARGHNIFISIPIALFHAIVPATVPLEERMAPRRPS